MKSVINSRKITVVVSWHRINGNAPESIGFQFAAENVKIVERVAIFLGGTRKCDIPRYENKDVGYSVFSQRTKCGSNLL